MNHSVHGRMSLLFTGFIVLVISSVTISFTLIDAHTQDAQVINLAGRQRMLIQHMVRLSLEYQQDGKTESLLSLGEAAANFERTLLALERGDNPGYTNLPWFPPVSTNRTRFESEKILLPPTRDPQILHQLNLVKAMWSEYKASIDLLFGSAHNSREAALAVDALRSKSDALTYEADWLVRLYEESSSTKVEYLRLVQLAFLAGSVVVLGLGGALTQVSVLKPLKQLSRAAELIGGGDLQTPIKVAGPREIRLVSKGFEKMRADLNQSHQELVEWAGTLEKQVAERTQELEALFSVTRDITSRLELPDVLQSVTDQACKLLKGDAAFLCLLDESGRSLKLHAYSGNIYAVGRSVTPVCNSPAAQVLSGDQALSCGRNGCKDNCQIISPEYRNSHLIAPLRIGGQNGGALCVSSKKQDALSSDSCKQLDKLAHVTVIALENAKLYQQAERMAMVEERQRIAAEMHDGLAQSISTIQMGVDLAKIQIELGKTERATETLSHSRAAIDQSIKDVRRAILSLQEEYPSSISLQNLLAGLAGEFSSQEWEVCWENKSSAPILLPNQQKEQISRVVREGLLNARSHSRSSLVILRLAVVGEKGIVSIEDNGQGFDQKMHLEGTQNGSHFGLKIMKARAARIGGSLEIRSSPGNGTRVTLKWPLRSTDRKGG